MPDGIIGKEEKKTRAALVSLVTRDTSEREAEISLCELERLCETAGAEVIFKMMQNKETPDPRTYIGKGKVEELSGLCRENDIDSVVFDCELSPSQIRNLEDDIGGDAVVIDRSMLILDIFAIHAVTGEGKLQVELAQLKYTVPRLVGKGSELSRLGGGVGTRGPGESKLETDRRHVKRRMDALEAQIAEMAKNREIQRAQRDRSGIFKFAVAGYTNAGKSTLLNRLTDAGILSEDKLFATLDPTTRKFTLPCGDDVLITDTVGFIRNLPHHLIKAFKSTFEEVCHADAVIIMADASDAEADSQLAVTNRLMDELGAGEKPIIYVYNKCDRGIACHPVTPTEKSVYISALTGTGTEELVAKMEKIASEGKKLCVFDIPMDKLGVINSIYSNAAVQNVEYGESFASVTAVADGKARGMFEKYMRK